MLIGTLILLSGCGENPQISTLFESETGQAPTQIPQSESQSPSPTEPAAVATPTIQPEDTQATTQADLLGPNAATISSNLAAGGALPNASPTPGVPQTPTPPPDPTATLAPNDLLLSGADNLYVGNYPEAIARYEAYLGQAGDQDGASVDQALLNLGIAHQENGSSAEAIAVWSRYLNEASQIDPRVYYWLGTSLRGEDPEAAIRYFTLYLESNPDMGAYVLPTLAALQPQIEVDLLTESLDSGAFYLTHIATRRRLADLYLDSQAYDQAIIQYQLIREAAFTENTKGEMTYRIGQTFLAADNIEEAYNAYRIGITDYPRAYESYLGLVALVEGGQPVDQFQRGLVDYYVAVYGPAVEAFDLYIAETPDYRSDTHLYLAWSLEGLGEYERALTELDNYLALNPDDPEALGRYVEEKAGIQTRSISVQEAISTLTTFVEENPDNPKAVWASYRAAILADRFLVDAAQATILYGDFLNRFPDAEWTAESAFRLGTLNWSAGELEAAIAAWEVAAGFSNSFGKAALIWLNRSASDANPIDITQTVAYQSAQAGADDYYSLRARVLQGEIDLTPFSTSQVDLNYDEATERQAVEAWIRTQFGLPDEAAVSSELDPAIATDPRVIRGEKLWQLREFELAKLELESVRQGYADNAQLSYQLALYFRDLGIYRSSILAAEAVMRRAGVTVFDAPTLIGRLAYPIYFEELFLTEADKYGFDPLLHTSLVRQESLFEGFAISSASAQGLSQIIPDTGVYVANKLAWEGYQNSDLYRPHVNLTFGAFYFNEQLEFFDNNFTPALAAYNGGPGNAIRWREAAGDDHDLYLETINFGETRLYVRQIYRNYVIYRYLYGGI